jgi:hypothetical protein
MIADMVKARAILNVRHDRPYDFDEKSGVWLYRKESEEEVGNILTDAGRRAIHTLIYGTAAQKTSISAGVGLHYIGLTNNATAPAAGDTVLTTELFGNGLTRALGTVTLPTGSGTITTIAKQFTYTGGTNQSVQKTALFDASTGGNMAHEILFTQRLLVINDTLTLTFSITLT